MLEEKGTTRERGADGIRGAATAAAPSPRADGGSTDGRAAARTLARGRIEDLGEGGGEDLVEGGSTDESE